MDFQCVSTGIFIGSGMQTVVALSNLASYYVIGLPVGIALMFAAKLRVLGNVFTQTNPCVFVQGLCPVTQLHFVFNYLFVPTKEISNPT